MFESTLARLQPPDRKTLKAFRFNFFHGRPGDELSLPMLGGHDSTVYDDADDLIALCTTDDPDRLTVFVRDNFGFLFQVTNQRLTLVDYRTEFTLIDQFIGGRTRRGIRCTSCRICVGPKDCQLHLIPKHSPGRSAVIWSHSCALQYHLG